MRSPSLESNISNHAVNFRYCRHEMNEIRRLMKNATDDDVSDLIDLVSEKAIEVGMSKPGFLRLMAEAFDFASRKENQ
jgi:hypothetical protein